MVHFNIKTQNLELVNLKRITYPQRIPPALSLKPLIIFYSYEGPYK